MASRTFKDSFASGPRFGLFQMIRDAQVAGLLARGGWDFALVDTEHIAINPETLQVLLVALRAQGLGAVVRLADTRRATVQTALEAGADALLAPMCADAEEARSFVDVARYPPAGSRGFHGMTEGSDYARQSPAEHIQTANDNILLGVQIETIGGLEKCEEIAAVRGMDLIFVGTGDLSVSMGQAGSGDSPELRGAIDRVCKAAAANHLIAGAYSSRGPMQAYCLERGVRFLACGSDGALLTQAARAARGQLPALS